MMGGVVGEHSGDGEQTTRRSTILLVEMTTTARRGELTGGAPVAWDVRLASVTVYMSARNSISDQYYRDCELRPPLCTKGLITLYVVLGIPSELSRGNCLYVGEYTKIAEYVGCAADTSSSLLIVSPQRVECLSHVKLCQQNCLTFGEYTKIAEYGIVQLIHHPQAVNSESTQRVECLSHVKLCQQNCLYVRRVHKNS
ncbi:hypothetical protein J6590_087293 [Homalodisca vitripennis]|nr:hypothetical protein J6590_087293 [Homalodisca vitripennis]